MAVKLALAVMWLVGRGRGGPFLSLAKAFVDEKGGTY